MPKATQLADLEVRGDLVGVKTVDKKYTDEEGEVRHVDFIEAKILLAFDADTLGKLGALTAKHELVAFGFSPVQGELPLVDMLAHIKTDAKKDRAA